MSRVVEGTSMAGFRCDLDKCGAKAVAAPKIRVPWEDVEQARRPPITVIRDLHVCREHQRAVRLEDELDKPLKRLVEQIAESNGGRPDFRRAVMGFIRVHSPEFQEFQEKQGLVKKGDATPQAEGMGVFMPKVE